MELRRTYIGRTKYILYHYLIAGQQIAVLWPTPNGFLVVNEYASFLSRTVARVRLHFLESSGLTLTDIALFVIRFMSEHFVTPSK